MGVIASALLAIHPPPEAGLLETLGDPHGICGCDALEDLQSWISQKSLQPRCCEALAGQPQKGHKPLAQSWRALLASVGESPGNADPSGVVITEDGAEERGIALHIWRHHQDIAWLQAWIRGQPLQDLIANQLHLAPRPCAGQKAQ